MAEKTGRTHETRDRRPKPQPRNDEEGRGNGDGTPFGELTRAADEAAGATQRSMDRFEPIMRNVARANLELIGWMGRRARAAAEMPRQLVRCETPQDLLSEQGRFLQEMMRDFTGTTTRLLSMWTGDMPGERSRSARD